jgi:hypothetical protein
MAIPSLTYALPMLVGCSYRVLAVYLGRLWAPAGHIFMKTAIFPGYVLKTSYTLSTDYLHTSCPPAKTRRYAGQWLLLRQLVI